MVSHAARSRQIFFLSYFGRPAERRGIHRSPGAAQDNISPAGRREKPEYGERRA
nr:MAG TPA: hypothetical protein [Caudoviricetes sp.]